MKRKNRSKRSMGSVPKGLPVKGFHDVNPFEVTHRQKKVKHQVHNRNTKPNPKTQSSLAKALERRKAAIRESLESSKKANLFEDKRIGEYDRQMSEADQTLARLVRERSRRSKRASKFSLQDDDVLTHRGKAIDNLTARDHVMLSDDEEDEGNLDAVDTALHFGGGKLSNATPSIYGPSDGENDLAQAYSRRKLELDDLILRRKLMKAEKMKSKEEQVEKFEEMDDKFSELAAMLSFRDKGKESKEHLVAKRESNLTTEDKEMDEWDKEMKEYQFLTRKVKAADRTKTAEEIAKEEAERLQKLEARRLARMNGDFDRDDFSDISDDGKDGNRTRKRTRRKVKETEEVDDTDDDASDTGELRVRFTSEGLVQINKEGMIVNNLANNSGNEDDGVGKEFNVGSTTLKVGSRVTASYRAREQFDGSESWFTGKIYHVNIENGAIVSYDIEYDDGDFEEGVEPQNVKPLELPKEEREREEEKKVANEILKSRRAKAREKARTGIPFVFEVPTTLDALHDLIAAHATTGEDASLIIKRIYATNSVRLDRRNSDRMQNFYDVLLRRFVAIGDAIHVSGDGGEEIGRYRQLNVLTEIMYAMAQDAPDCAGAVWGRRIGVFQNAHAKRLRDAELEVEDDNFTAWPSTGVFLALRALGHIFPTTDQRHYVVTPTVLLLGQMISYTPILHMYDLVMGLLCCGLLLEYTKDARRIVPEALAFISSVISLFWTHDEHGDQFMLPNLAPVLQQDNFASLRTDVAGFCGEKVPLLSFEKKFIEGTSSAIAILHAALHLTQAAITNLAGNVADSEKELFAMLTQSILALNPKDKVCKLPEITRQKIAQVATTIADVCSLDLPRIPLHRRSGLSVREKAIKSLAPRLENPERYSMSKDKGKNATQAAADRIRREYKREQKAISRELRLDAAALESERRNEKEKKDSAARAKRQKAFSWLEGEQAAMNHQVRQGGGLLKGGGMGAARAKASSAKLGIKKGGKL